jgi:hypothetical protein
LLFVKIFISLPQFIKEIKNVFMAKTHYNMKTQPFTILLVLSIFIVFLLYCFYLCTEVRYFTDEMIIENLPIALGSAVGIFLIEQLLKEGKAAKH